jgi:hypothetical protein
MRSADIMELRRWGLVAQNMVARFCVSFLRLASCSFIVVL